MASWDRIFSIGIHPGACVSCLNIQPQEPVRESLQLAFPQYPRSVQLLVGCRGGHEVNFVVETGREKITLSPVASATLAASATTTRATAAGAAATAEAWRRHLWRGPILLRSLIPLLRYGPVLLRCLIPLLRGGPDLLRCLIPLLRRGALHLPVRRSRQSVPLIL